MSDIQRLENSRNDLDHASFGGRDPNGHFYRRVNFSEASKNLNQDLRVTEKSLIFESSHQFSKETLTWDESLAGAATSTHNAVNGRVQMAVTAAAGDQVIRQSYRFVEGFIGRSKRIYMAVDFDGDEAGIRKRAGQFWSNDGFFLELYNGVMSIVFRNNAVDVPTAQSDWNIDKFDGKGPSGLTIDWTDQYVLVLEQSWVCSNYIRFGLLVEGVLYYFHKGFFGHNTGLHLPLRVELTNVAGGTAGSMSISASKVDIDGKEDQLASIRVSDSGVAALSLNTTESIISAIRIRPGSIGSSIKPLRVEILPNSGVSDSYYRILANANIVGGSWSDIGEIAQRLDSYTSFNGGTPIKSGHINLQGAGPSGITPTIESVLSNYYLGMSIAEVPTNFVVVMRTFSGAGSISQTTSFREFR